MTMPAELESLLGADPRFKGAILKQGGLVQIVAATTSYTLYQRTAGRAVWLVGVLIYNDHSSAVRVSIGTGDFTANMPQLGPILASYSEMFWFPPREYTADIVIQSDGAGASPGEVEAQAWVLER